MHQTTINPRRMAHLPGAARVTIIVGLAALTSSAQTNQLPSDALTVYRPDTLIYSQTSAPEPEPNPPLLHILPLLPHIGVNSPTVAGPTVLLEPSDHSISDSLEPVVSSRTS